MLLATVLGFTAGGTLAAELPHRQIVDGVAVYFGMMPAELVRGHPREHPESEMHGGVPVGENHLTVALFDDKTGERIARAEIAVTIAGPGNFKVEKKLEPMIIAGAATFGNYFNMPGPGPYRIDLTIRLPGGKKSLRARFEWARS